MAENVYEDPANPKVKIITKTTHVPLQTQFEEAGSSRDQGGNVYVKEGTTGKEPSNTKGKQISAKEGAKKRNDVKGKDSGPKVSEELSKRREKREKQTEKKRKVRGRKYERETNTRKKLDLKERQERERKRMFGSFSKETGWKVILSFVIYVFLVSAAICILVIFIYTWQNAPPKGLADETRKLIRDVYKSLKIRMDDLDDVLEKEVKTMAGSLKNHTKEMETNMKVIQEKTLKGLNSTKDVVKDRAKEQKIRLDKQFKRHTETINLHAQELHKKTLNRLSTLDSDMLKRFTGHDELISGHRKQVITKFAAHQTSLSGSIDDLQKIIANGFSEKDVGFKDLFAELHYNIQSDMSELLDTVSITAKDEGDYIIEKVEELEGAIATGWDTERDLVEAKLKEQDMTIQEFLDNAIYDINSYTKEIETNVLEHISTKSRDYEEQVISKLDETSTKLQEVSNNLTTALDAAVLNTDEMYAIANTNFSEVDKAISEKKNALVLKITNALNKTFSDLVKYEAAQTCEETRFTTAVTDNPDSDGAVYSMYFPSSPKTPIPVFCSLKHEGWMVIMRLENSDTSIFNAPYEDYLKPMGSIEHGNYWMGLENMHSITQSQTYKLRVELVLENGDINIQVFDLFRVGSASTDFKAKVGPRNAGESTAEIEMYKRITDINGKTFSTYDRGTHQACAVLGGAGWWYHTSGRAYCQEVKLTGVYYDSAAAHSGNKDGIIVGDIANYYKRAEMAIKYAYSDKP
ncbi:uncharacterized protein LOC120340070 isoform X2 [Styela clava]